MRHVESFFLPSEFMASSSTTRSPDHQSFVGVWQPNQRPPGPQYVARKAQPIKRVDSEPLWRKDIQYDFLYYLFSDRTRAFIDYQAPERPVVNFCDLYVNALYNSSKCSKVLKDKMVETPAFAIEFAKISLLTNVGRINTTMAFFPEMKTALRSYHPVPSLQKTDGNLQDAPRIKNCLKAALLPFEAKGNPPSTPTSITEKADSGQIPTTSVVNLIFVLATYSTLLGPLHFEHPLDFMDLFLPHPLSSASRAKAFLWLIFHYYQGPHLPNPFADEYAQKNPGKMPRIQRLTEEEMNTENVDLPEEVEWARRKSAQRSHILRDLIETEELEKKAKGKLMPTSAGPKVGYARPRNQRTPPKREDATKLRENFIYYLPGDQPPTTVGMSNGTNFSAPIPSSRHQPYPIHRRSYPGSARRVLLHDQRGRGMSMIDHAFRRALTTDPLADSDEDMDYFEDAESRRMNHIDRSRRLYVISRLRGRSVTPEPEQPLSNYTETRYHQPNLLHPSLASHQQPLLESQFRQSETASAPLQRRSSASQDVRTTDLESSGAHSDNNHQSQHRSPPYASPIPSPAPVPPSNSTGRLQQVQSWR